MGSMEKVRDYLEKSGMSANSLAKGAGYTAAALSQWLAGKYTGDNAKVEAALLAFIDRQNGKTPSVVFVKTSAVRKVRDVADVCRADGDIGLVCGGAGTGKTTACKHYAQNNHGVVYISANDGITAKEFFEDLAKEFSLSDCGTIHRYFTAIKNSLNRKNRMIIVDEADRLPFRALSLLRSLFDETGCGLVLVGTERLKANVEGKGRDRSKYEQLYSRIGMYQKTGGSDIVEDIKNIVNSAIPNLSNACVSAFVSASGNSLRRAQKLVRVCVRMASVNSCEIAPDMIKAASGYVIG